MSQPEWFPSDPTGSKPQDQHMTFISLSTVDDLSYTPSEEQKSRDRAQIKATGRRSWKTLKGKAEAVWSPELEAVLIEALEQYQHTDDHKPTTSKHGIRFPYRNRFISQYIYEKTGRARTHKQVGSRLQQLRDTCEDNRILALISRGSCNDTDDDSKGEIEQSPPPSRRGASSSPPQDDGKSQKPGLVVYTQITAQTAQPPYGIPRFEFLANDISDPITLNLRPLPHHQGVRGLPSPSLSIFSNSVQLYSAWPLSQETAFVIYKGDRPVRQERGTLRQISRPSGLSQGWIYECNLAGPSWKTICETSNPNSITILQSLTPVSITSSELATESPFRKVSVVYHFGLDEQPAQSVQASPPMGTTMSYGPATTFAGQPTPSSSYTSPSAMWNPQGYQGRDGGYGVGGVLSHPSLIHSQSYPPSVGHSGQHYVLDSHQGMVRSHSGSSAGHSDYDVGHGALYYAEPRMGQWSTDPNISSAGDPSFGATGRRPSGYGVDYAC